MDFNKIYEDKKILDEQNKKDYQVTHVIEKAEKCELWPTMELVRMSDHNLNEAPL